MAGFMDANTNYLIRTNIWSRTIKQLLLDELNAMKFVRIISDFPDGYTINIPSIGDAKQADFVEGQAIKYDSMDTGNFTFSFDSYKYSANAISEKFKRDSYYSQDVIAAFVPRQHRVLMEGVETSILAKANSGQTVSNLNTINNAAHRFVGSGTANSAVALAVSDLARAQNSLIKANVPQRNLIGIIDPSVAYTLQTQTNLVNFISPNQRWHSVVSETVNSVAVTNGVANYFFSAAPGDTMPWVGAFRQMPTVYSEFNKDLQQEEYLTITEYGFKLYRPENLVTILTSTSVVPS